ncbi:MAG: glycosyltransferase family 39 protein [Deltaproteobacteria bacterium]|nr:glycosyltransferase family 39 protein [Deltaproteobacteria bacterium]
MKKSWKRPLLIGVSVVAVMLIALRLDPVIAGKVPQVSPLIGIADFFSLVGDGFVLFCLAATLYLAGYFLKKSSLRSAGRDGFISVLVSGIAVNILKASFERPRIGYGAGAVLRLLEDPRLFDLSGRFSSLPSGHTTVSFALAFTLSRRYPSLRYLFYATAALVAASRVYLGAHYPSDVVAGALVGILAGWLLLKRAESPQRLKAAALVLLIVFVSFFKNGGYLLFDVDEAVFSEASREMYVTGDVITPAYNNEPRYDKPILIYWLMSLSFKLFGVSEAAARFTSAAFGSLLVFMTFLFICRVKGWLPGVFSALSLLLCMEYFTYSHSAVTDMTLTFFISASVYSFYLAAHEEGRLWPILFWIFAALAVLTKGAIGLVFPVAIALLYLAASRGLNRFRGVLRPGYILIFLLVSAPWYLIQLYINGWEFFNAFVIKHHIQRFSGVISSHGGPFYYYLVVLLIGFFPWVAFLPSAIHKGVKERLRGDSALYLLSSVWFLFVLAFFTIARTKLPNYIMPLFPAASILSGLTAAELVEGGMDRRPGLYILVLISVVLGAAMFVLPHMEISMDVAFPNVFFYSLGLIFLGAAAFGLAAFKAPRASFAGISALVLFLLIFLRLYALPPVNAYLQKTLYVYSRYAARNLGQTDALATYEINKPSIPFYFARTIVKSEKATACDLTERSKRGKMLVITEASRYDEVKGSHGLEVIDSRGGYVLLGTPGEWPPVDAASPLDFHPTPIYP